MHFAIGIQSGATVVNGVVVIVIGVVAHSTVIVHATIIVLAVVVFEHQQTSVDTHLLLFKST